MAGRSRTWAVAALLAGLIAIPAAAQNTSPQKSTKPPATTGSVALPKPGQIVPPQALRARAQAAGTTGQAPASNPFAQLLGKTNTGQLTPEQSAIITKVETYMSNMQVMSGNFVQVGPDGRRSKGDFYIQKPGRVRFEYDDPSPIQLIADGQTVVVRDRNLATQDVFPLSQTPLRFLLADRVNLMKDTKLVAVYADEVFITIVVEEKNPLVGTSRLMIMFSAKDMQLKQWTVTDPQGYDTTVAVFNLDTTRRPDPSMFKIDYTNYKN